MDISKIWPGWTITERLGHGGFGHVYKATCAETDAVAAVKVITIPDNPDIIEDLRYLFNLEDEEKDVQIDLDGRFSVYDLLENKHIGVFDGSIEFCKLAPHYAKVLVCKRL